PTAPSQGIELPLSGAESTGSRGARSRRSRHSLYFVFGGRRRSVGRFLGEEADRRNYSVLRQRTALRAEHGTNRDGVARQLRSERIACIGRQWNIQFPVSSCSVCVTNKQTLCPISRGLSTRWSVTVAYIPQSLPSY